MAARKKKYKVTRRRVVFSKGPIHLVDCIVRMRNGRSLTRQILEHPGSVVMIPRVSPGRYILVRQFRFAAGDWMWEFPAGGREPGESLKAAASRELREEIGFRPKKLRRLFSFFPSPGISGEIMHLFLAEDLVPGRGTPDEDEDIEMRIFTAAAIRRMIRSGQIVDAKTLLGFYHLERKGR